MPKICADQYTDDELAAMRAWVADACAQAVADLGLSIDDLYDEDIVSGVAHHYEGGINAFLDHFYDAA